MISILPLAINMIIGPQIITSILLIPSEKRIPNSLAYIFAIAFATFSGIFLFYMISEFFHFNPHKRLPSDHISYIQIGICLLLIGLSIVTYLKRKTAKEPFWIKKIETINPIGSFKLGLFLIFAMPADFLTMLVIGLHLSNHQIGFLDLFGFTFFVTFLVSIPLMICFLFKQKFQKILPNLQLWLDNNNWVISIGSYFIFILIILGVI